MKKYLLVLAVGVLGLLSAQTNANRTTTSNGVWTEWKLDGAKFSSRTIDCYYYREFFPNNGDGRFYKVEKRTFTKPRYPDMYCPMTMKF